MELNHHNKAQTSFARTPGHVVTEDMGEETVILDLEQSRYCSLNGVGSRMFVLVQEKPSLDEVIRVLGEEYDIDIETVRQDIVELIDRLVKEGLLVVNG
jgi:hypothetical protein